MKTRWVPLVTLLLAFGAGAASADVVLESRYPVEGESVRVRIMDEAGNPVSGAAVEVTYRPGSSVQRTEPIGASDTGFIQWTPSEAGIATITATWTGADQTEQSTATNVSVKFSGPPIDGIVIMVVAGFLLVIGSVIRVANLLRSPDAP